MRTIERLTVAAALAVGLGACAAAPPRLRSGGSSLEIPPLAGPVQKQESAGVRFLEGMPAPSGCIGISRRTGAVACVVGQYASTNDSGDRHVIWLGSETPDLPIHVGPEGTLATPSRLALDQRMRDDDFIALPAPSVVPPESPEMFAELDVVLHVTDGPAKNGATVRTVVRPHGTVIPEYAWDSEVVLDDRLEDVRCAAPTLAVRLLDQERVLIERICHLDDGGIAARAWLCDSRRPNCEG